ncbi:hypothetical protein JRO89_XS03G0311300 [Xanthoceras sorbifolium]|uniref:Phorbol-ester/DAG-type domain-containing protein n=1 Tax=Xanthoceras sorbifolium TaxID=99658 RepID=A0ABQ8ID95_9ROSI|nr:hypothetical protein JRO89_XS03G0311300 [Xanthoceras sorbifolium]
MNVLQRVCHEFEYTFHEFYEGKDDDHPMYCSICCKVICGPAYITGEDTGHFHKACAELPGKIQHPLHSQHPLKIGDLRRGFHEFVCDGCWHYSVSFKYQCKMCNFKLDFQCVSKHDQRQELEERMIITNYIHGHELELLYFSLFTLKNYEFCCCCCTKGIRDSAYVCFQCMFFIHGSCLGTIPYQVESSFHPQHPLLPHVITGGSTDCRGCGAHLAGIGLRCQRCRYSFHVSCGKHTTPGIRLVQVHEHNLFYIRHPHQGTSNCVVCEKRCEGAIYRCIECEENFHVECILPSGLTHECHDHRLTLTNSVVPKCNPNEFRCDICEKEGDLKHHVYHCEECYYIAHVECVVNEEEEDRDIDESDESSDVSENSSGVSFAMLSDAFEESSDESEENSDELEENSDESEEMTDTEEEKSYLEELNKNIADVKEEIDRLTIKLHCLEEKRAKIQHFQSQCS